MGEDTIRAAFGRVADFPLHNRHLRTNLSLFFFSFSLFSRPHNDVRRRRTWKKLDNCATDCGGCCIRDATNAICRGCFLDFRRSVALFATAAAAAAHEEKNKRERGLSPISATGGNRHLFGVRLNSRLIAENAYACPVYYRNACIALFSSSTRLIENFNSVIILVHRTLDIITLRRKLLSRIMHR